MNDRLNQCCDRLKQEIKTVETCLAGVGDHLASATEEKVEALKTRLEEALTKCNARREQAKTAGERVRQFLEQKKSEVVSKYEDWKTDREIDKLEDQAVDAVVVAAFALLEAEVAIVEALKARKTVIEVAG